VIYVHINGILNAYCVPFFVFVSMYVKQFRPAEWAATRVTSVASMGPNVMVC